MLPQFIKESLIVFRVRISYRQISYWLGRAAASTENQLIFVFAESGIKFDTIFQNRCPLLLLLYFYVI